jgi:hypothetical protein
MSIIERISFLLGDSTVVADVQPALLGFKTKKKKKPKAKDSEQLCRRIR